MIGTKKERQAVLENLYPKWEELTLFQFLERKAEKLSGQIFLLADGVCLTYRQTLDGARKIAGALRQLDVGCDTRVAVCLNNCPEYILLVFALSGLGAVKVSINTELGEEERHSILEQADPYLLIEGGPQGITVVRYGAEDAWKMSWSTLCDLGAGTKFEPAGDPNRICEMIFTSGSNGIPKGVTLTSDMLLRSAYANCLNRGFELGRLIYIPLPLFHVYGYVEGLIAALLGEGSILIHRGKFTPEKAIRLMEQYRVNDLLSVPSMMMNLLNCPALEQADLSALHAVYCSASSCPAWLWPAIREKLGVRDVITGYGMTETSGAVMQTSPDDADGMVVNRVGRLLPGGSAGVPAYQGCQAEYRVADPITGISRSAGQSGELWCRGPVVTKRYFRNDQANAAAFTPDGWLKTGDIGRFDQEGCLELLGRLSDMYKINGENVAPQFVERVIGQCEMVVHVEVVGVPDAKTGEAGAAFLELTRGTDRDTAYEVISQHCRKRLARFQIPKYYYFLSAEEWPLTGSGKISKRLLRIMVRNDLQHTEPTVRTWGL